MNKLLAHETLVDLYLFKLLPKFIRGRELNIDCYWVDQRRYKREMRRYKHRLKAIKLATSYTVTKEEVAENLYSTELTEASLEELSKLMLQNWDNVKINPTKIIIPPWAVDEIVATYGEFTTENYFKWCKARYGI